jgi:hypothetical protein
MSSLPWKEYLSIFIDKIREAYETELTNFEVEPKAFFESKSFVKRFTFPKPCQITVLEFVSKSLTLWIVNFEESKPDKVFKIIEGIKEDPDEFLKNHREYERYAALIKIAAFSPDTMPYLSISETFNVMASKDSMEYVFYSNLRKTIHPRDLALKMFYERRIDVLRIAQRSRIEKIASEMRDEAKELGLLGAEKTLEDTLDKLKIIDEHEQKLITMEDELTGVRKLVGTRTFGEWKVLLAEIDKVNTRIDAFSNIKDAYDKVLAQQNEFMKQQADVMKQQASFVTWIKYSAILVPIAVISVPIIEIIRILLGIR